MKYDIVLFDLDGTLLNTLEDLADSVNYVMMQMGYPVHPLESIRQFVGNGIRILMVKATPQGEENPRFEEAFAMFKAYYLTHNQIKTRPYDGVMELLHDYEEQDMPMAIVTNKNQESVDVLVRDVFKNHVRVAVHEIKCFFQKILFIHWHMSECSWRQLYRLERVSLVFGWLRY